MKKLIILSIAVLSLSSCIKKHSCMCSNGSEYMFFEYGGSRSQAEINCSEMEYVKDWECTFKKR